MQRERGSGSRQRSPARPALAALGWPLVVAAAVAACSFDSASLAERACSAGGGGGCPSGQRCCEGYCVATGSCPDAGIDAFGAPDLGPDLDPAVDRDLDGVRDEEDNCPDTPNTSQIDADRDGLGDLCDCAPTDGAFGTTLYGVSRFEALAPFVGVEQPASWKVVGGLLEQGATDGLQRARHGDITGRADLLVLAVVRFTGQGDDGLQFDLDDKPSALAGLVVRTGDLAAGRGDGYYCALDRKNVRLIIGRTAADDLQQGEMHLFGDVAGPGTGIIRPIRDDTPYTLTLRVTGQQIGCRALLPDRSQVETSAEDATLSSGGVALFTAGASAQIESVKVCGTN